MPTHACPRLLSLPYSKRTSTDEFKVLSHISGLLETVCEAFTQGVPPRVQLQAAQVGDDDYMITCLLMLRPSSSNHMMDLRISSFVTCEGG